MPWGNWDMRRYLRSSECGLYSVAIGMSSCISKSCLLSSDLAESIMDLDTSILVPFPQFDGSKFRRLVDREMGFEL
jgi:hypothetical protein